MKFRLLAPLLAVFLSTGAFADSSWTITRTTHGTAEPNVSNPKGQFDFTVGGTNLTPVVHATNGFSFNRGNSENLGGSKYNGTGVKESDSADVAFQSIGTFAFHTYGTNSMGYVVTINFANGVTKTIGSWPARGHSGNPPNYDGNYYYSGQNEFTDLVKQNPKQSFTVLVYVYWDYKSDGDWYGDGPFPYNFNYIKDTSPPTLTEVGSSVSTVGSSVAHTWTFQSQDSRGVGELILQPQYSKDQSLFQPYGTPTIATPTGTPASFQYQFSPPLNQGDGYYRMAVTALNSDDDPASPSFAATLNSSVYGLDTTGPVFSAPASASFSADGKIQVSWGLPSDAVGSLPANPIQVTYEVNGGNPTTLVSSGPSTLTSATLPFSEIFYGSTISFTVSVSDGVGNVTDSTASVALPPALTMLATVDPVSDTQTMVVDLQFNLTPQTLKSSFTSIAVDRFSSADGSPTLGSLTLPISGITLDGSGIFVPSNGWSTDSDGYARYTDFIPVSTGAGHKTWQYTPRPTPWIGAALPPAPVVLPNHQGSVTMSIVGADGAAYDPANPTAFQLGTDRKVSVVFQGRDADRDHWSYRLIRLTQTGSQNASLTGTAPLSVQTEYPYADGYAAQTLPVSLNEGINNLAVTWIEGDPTPVYRSDVLSITVAKTSTGTYQIQVATVSGDVLPSDGSPIITRPGEPLSFSLTGGGALSYAWDFGDGTPVKYGSAIDYAYDQKPDQTTDTADYTLQVTVTDGTVTQTVPLNITVKDTQEGVLYKNETWHGDHTVTGLVEVPFGKELDILPAHGSGASITFSGGFDVGYGQSILVDSGASLIVGDNMTFKGDSPNGWGTIQISGNAVIGISNIQGADRGVTVGPDAVVKLNGTLLHDNKIALHIVGTSDTRVTGASITDNTVYGIKEDGGRPQVNNTAFANNFRTYYSWDQGLITVDTLNQRAGNTGNTGE